MTDLPEIPELLKEIMGHKADVILEKLHQIKILKMTDEDVEKEWVQVATLKPIDITRRRNLNAKSAEAKRDFEILKKKMAAIKAQVDIDSDEFWRDIHKGYGLTEGNYHVHEDGRVFMEPKEK